MRHWPCVAGALFAAMSCAAAAPRYDKALEKAAADIVAARMGGMRGAFSYAQRPAFVRAQASPAEPAGTGEGDSAVPGRDLTPGLAPAVEASRPASS